jgi:hypothetical protein
MSPLPPLIVTPQPPSLTSARQKYMRRTRVASYRTTGNFAEFFFFSFLLVMDAIEYWYQS